MASSRYTERYIAECLVIVVMGRIGIHSGFYLLQRYSSFWGEAVRKALECY